MPGDILETSNAEDHDLARWRREWQREVSAVTAGICPVHSAALDPVATVDPRDIAGHCTTCRKYWRYQRATEEVGWTLDYRPYLHGLVVPEWVAT